jgi:hypothetical protein
MARPFHEPTEQSKRDVLIYAAMGVAQEQIADLVGLDPKTLRKHYRDELDHGKIRAAHKVVGTLFSVASDRTHPGCTTAGIFYCKTQLGWKEPKDDEKDKFDAAATQLNQHLARLDTALGRVKKEAVA